eukprot:11052738-Alexandrium_andersonii.AAC.1
MCIRDSPQGLPPGRVRSATGLHGRPGGLPGRPRQRHPVQARSRRPGALLAAGLGGRVGHAAGAARGAAVCPESAVQLGRGRQRAARPVDRSEAGHEGLPGVVRPGDEHETWVNSRPFDRSGDILFKNRVGRSGPRSPAAGRTLMVSWSTASAGRSG